MGRFIYNHKSSSEIVDESRLRSSGADSDLSGTDYYHSRRAELYKSSNAGFHPGPTTQNSNNTNGSVGDVSNKLSYLKAEIDFMVDGFMREMIDFESFANLSPEIQQEIIVRYPQFFN